MNFRKAFGIVLFVGIGLFMFTFANPNDKVDNGENNSQANATNEVQNDNTDNKKGETTNALVAPTNPVAPAANGNTNGNENANVNGNNNANGNANGNENGNVVDNISILIKSSTLTT